MDGGFGPRRPLGRAGREGARRGSRRMQRARFSRRNHEPAPRAGRSESATVARWKTQDEPVAPRGANRSRRSARPDGARWSRRRPIRAWTGSARDESATPGRRGRTLEVGEPRGGNDAPGSSRIRPRRFGWTERIRAGIQALKSPASARFPEKRATRRMERQEGHGVREDARSSRRESLEE